MNILSFDCANRTLAFTWLQINNIENYENIKNFVIVKCTGVKDITNSKLSDITDIDRSKKLYDFLKELSDKIPEYGLDCVFVEHQPRKNQFNVKADASYVEQQIIYHFISIGINVRQISPKLKTKIAFSSELTHENITNENLQKGKYCINKIHSVKNFLYFIKVFNIEIKLADKKNLDDQADSFMQIFGYIFRK